MSEQYTTLYNSPLGVLELLSSSTHLLSINFITTLYPQNIQSDIPSVLIQTKKWLDAYFSQKPVSAKDIPLSPEGTLFQKQVWEALKEIPYGTTMSYKNLAQIIAKQRGVSKISAQAIGQAVSKNPIPIIIPCHRIIGSKGQLTGYAYGLNNKIKLLNLEQITYLNKTIS